MGSILFTLMACCLMACTYAVRKDCRYGNRKRNTCVWKRPWGNITVKLYNETPKHRDNFIKLAKRGYLWQYALPPRNQEFDSSWRPTEQDSYRYHYIGNGDVGYTLPAEFNPLEILPQERCAGCPLGWRSKTPKRNLPDVSSTLWPDANSLKHRWSAWRTSWTMRVWKRCSTNWLAKHIEEIYKMRKAGDKRRSVGIAGQPGSTGTWHHAKEPALKFSRENRLQLILP